MVVVVLIASVVVAAVVAVVAVVVGAESGGRKGGGGEGGERKEKPASGEETHWLDVRILVPHDRAPLPDAAVAKIVRHPSATARQ